MERIFGVIQECAIVDDLLVASGIAWEQAPEIIQAAAQPRFGMSFEIEGAYMEDMRAPVWTVARVGGFSGIAVRENVAFSSSFEWLIDHQGGA